MGGIIDAHSRIGAGRPEETRTPDEALRQMDAAGIAVAWVCPTDACVAVRNEEGNAAIAAIVRAHPDRFVGCAVANPWWGERAVEMVARAFGDGLRVLFLHPPLQAINFTPDRTSICSPSKHVLSLLGCDDFWSQLTADEFRVAIFLF